MNLEMILKNVKSELERARRNYPSNEKLLAAFNEEAGELTKAFLDHHYEKTTDKKLVEEAIQVICVAVRLIEEGDSDFNFKGWGNL